MDTKKLFAAIDKMDTEGFLGFLSDDVVFRFGNFPAVKGKEGVRDAVAQFFSSIDGLHHVIKKEHRKENSVIVEGEVTYTRKDKKKVTIPFSNIMEEQHGKFCTYLIYIDISPLYK
jgi:ketosteroid isomerase-like protein